MATTKGKLVSKIIWLVLALGLWITGLVIFLTNPDKLIGYVIWGALCAICTIKAVMSGAAVQGRKGRARGANDYTVTDNGSHYTVENHPVRGAILGFIGGLIGGVIAGPIVVPINVIRSVIDIVRLAKNLKNS